MQNAKIIKSDWIFFLRIAIFFNDISEKKGLSAFLKITELMEQMRKMMLIVHSKKRRTMKKKKNLKRMKMNRRKKRNSALKQNQIQT